MSRTSGLVARAPRSDRFPAPPPPPKRARRSAAERRPRRALRADTIRLAGQRYVADLADGGRAELTLDPRLQQSDRGRAARLPDPVRRRRRRLDPRRPRAGDGRAVGRRPAPGRRRAGAAPLGAGRVGVQGVSATALVENGVRAAPAPATTAASRRSSPDNLVDLPAIDRRCDTLAFGLGKSQNAIIAKLATRHLTADELARVGRSFGFGEAIPFELPVEPSHLDVPGDDARVRAHRRRLLALDAVADARRAAGRRHRQPRRDARPDADRSRRRPRRAADRAAGRRPRATSSTPRPPARSGRMMELTTRIGTAKGTFRDKRGPAPPARRGRRQDRHAVGRDRPRLRRLQLVRRLRPRRAPRRSPSPSSWATTRTGASRRPTSAATSSPSTSPRKPPAPRLLASK